MTELTIIIGKILAPYLLITGIGFFLSNKFYKEMTENAYKSDPTLINLSGMIHFLIGIAIISNHFRFGSLLEIIVTVLGLAFLLKGSFLVALPRLTLKSNKTSVKFLAVSSSVYIIAGLGIGLLSYFT